MRLAALALTLLASPALADTLNVPADFADIPAALAVAVPGDTIAVKGVQLLTGTIVVGVPGITLKGSKAVLDGQFIVENAVYIGADNVTMTGFTIVNAEEDGIASGPLVEGNGFPDGIVLSKLHILNCHGNGMGLFAHNATITSNRIAGCDQEGIYFQDGGEFIEGLDPGISTISKNGIVACGGDGMQVLAYSTVNVEKNICHNNREAGILYEVGLVVAEGIGPPASPPTIAGNTCTGNRGAGIEIFDPGVGLVIEKNTCACNGEDGISAIGISFSIIGNKVEANCDEGLDLDVTSSLIAKNKCEENFQEGIQVSPPVTAEGTTGFNTLEANTCASNGRDGIEILSDNNILRKNKVSGNLGDGIDVYPGLIGNLLDGNTCNGNTHEGIDNTGVDTDIVNNKCKNNAYGIGPDIAGAGDGGVGTVDEFDGNSFDTGGDTTPSRLDFGDDV